VNLIKAFLFYLLLEITLLTIGGGCELLFSFYKSILLPEYIASFGFLSSLAVITLIMWLFFPETIKKTSSLCKLSSGNVLMFLIIFFSIFILFILTIKVGCLLKLSSVSNKDVGEINLDRILSFFIAAIIIGLTEEILFRGFLGVYFFGKLNNISSILLISVLFSIGHIQYSGALPFITAFIFSITSFCIMLKTGSILGSIGLHSGWNFAFYISGTIFNIDLITVPFWGNLVELLQIILMLIVFSIIWFIPSASNKHIKHKSI
jgi:membrane protease YdiL (CAAX protease family)